MAFSDDQIRAMLRDPSRFPPSARLTGLELIDLSSSEGWAEFAFNPSRDFANPTGNVQGGFICGMLDDAMALAASISRGFTVIVPTLQMSVSFLNPAPVTRLLARGEVLRVGANTAQMQGTLRLPDGTPIAVATASAVVRPFPGREGR